MNAPSQSLALIMFSIISSGGNSLITSLVFLSTILTLSISASLLYLNSTSQLILSMRSLKTSVIWLTDDSDIVPGSRRPSFSCCCSSSLGIVKSWGFWSTGFGLRSTGLICAKSFSLIGLLFGAESTTTAAVTMSFSFPTILNTPLLNAVVGKVPAR